MTRWKLAVAMSIFVACDAGPAAPDSDSSERAAVPTVARTARALSVIVVPGQLVTLESGRGDTERAWVQGRIVMDVIGPDGAAKMDGAILVVSAADGPMPQTVRNAETLQIDINSGRIDADDILRFQGVAVLRDENGEHVFDITGSARPEADNPDCLIWDIVGSEWWDGAKFETAVVLRNPGT